MTKEDWVQVLVALKAALISEIARYNIDSTDLDMAGDLLEKIEDEIRHIGAVCATDD